MSTETRTWLNQNILVGDVAERGRAWHFSAAHQGDEGNHYLDAIPVDDVLRRLFSWSPVETPVTATTLTDDGRIVSVPTGRKLITRSDDGGFLGDVGEDHKIHRYADWLVHSWGKILDSDQVHISNAGLLQGGAKAFVQIARPDFIQAAGLEFRSSLLAVTVLDGSMSSTFKAVNTITVCDNTLAGALREKGFTHKTRHTSRSSLNVLGIREALGILHTQDDTFTSEIERLFAEDVSNERFGRWADLAVDLTPEKIEKGGRGLTIAQSTKGELLNLWNEDDRVAPWKGTALGVLQADNTWRHHFQGGLPKGSDAEKAAARAERNFERATTGEGAAADRRALALLATV